MRLYASLTFPFSQDIANSRHVDELFSYIVQ
nr:MAG TPA_asm: hypothetical protein [Bacteriophage sp.]